MKIDLFQFRARFEYLEETWFYRESNAQLSNEAILQNHSPTDYQSYTNSNNVNSEYIQIELLQFDNPILESDSNPEYSSQMGMNNEQMVSAGSHFM